MTDSLTSSADTCYLTDLSPKDKPWDSHRVQADRVRDLYRGTLMDALAGRIANCSGYLLFEWVVDAETGECCLKLKAARFCRVRHCPVCQWRRSLMWVARFLKALPAIQRDHPKARYLFLTLTVRNCDLEDLRKTLAWMNESWKRLTHRKPWPAIGFVRSTEVTRVWDWYDGSQYLGRHGWTWYYRWLEENPGRQLRSESTTECHPHFHAVLMVNPGYFDGKNYLKQERWAELWQSCLQVAYPPVVDVRAVKPHPRQLDADSELAAALVETLKYSVKPSDLIGQGTEEDRAWLLELTSQLHKTRAIALGGVFKNYLSESEPEDLIGEDLDAEQNAIGLISFGWRELVSRYLKMDL